MVTIAASYHFTLGPLVAVLSGAPVQTQPAVPAYPWPEGKRVALSLSFDDARLSQIDAGLALFDKHGVKATFYVVPSSVEKRLDGWKRAVAAGHEIGNHSLNHPCSGNFPWARKNALEEYTVEKMRAELEAANRRVKELLGVTPEVFAYPCGQKFVGRGKETRSYVPLVAELFLSGRGWMDEAPNDATYCDLAQVTGIEMDGKSFEQMRAVVEKAREAGQWVVLGGHEIGTQGAQTTRIAMLERLIKYAKDPANGVWLAPVGTVSRYVKERQVTR
jgi:peptidoglycan-N-acetylglucosamine deacetylase